jgi:hypothetical protein
VDTVITSRITGLEEHVVCTRKKRNESKILVRKSQRKRPTGRCRRIWEDYMILDFRKKERRCGCYLEKAVTF